MLWLWCTLLVALVSPASAAEPPTWAVFYYMAYDNNLEGAGPPILDMLQSGVVNDNVTVVVSADFRDAEGMRRYVLRPDGVREETRISEERSAHPDVLAAELAWAAETVHADRWAVVFLDHGGRLPEMSHDEHPGEGAPNWLYVPEVAEVVTVWRNGLEGSVELLFLQQCGKGSVRNYEALQHAAPVVMASQTVVGAPNTYYGGALRALSQSPEMSGEVFARTIIEHESPFMFTTYTAVRSTRIGELWPKVQALLALRRPGKGSAMVTFSMPPVESSLDLLALVQPQKSDAAEYNQAYEAFSTWVSADLLVAHTVSPVNKRARAWSGLSVVTALKGKLAWRGRWDGYLGDWATLPHP